MEQVDAAHRGLVTREQQTGPEPRELGVGERRVGENVAGHGVHYRGRLSDDGTTLEGTWWIEADPGRAVRRTEGTFLLRREGP